VNLLKNSIGFGQATDLVSILKEHPTLKSLCGNKGNETELDMSGKMGGAEDAIMLAAEVVDNGALTSLNLANNSLGQPVLPEGWTNNSPARIVFKHVDGREQTEDPGSKPEGIIAIASAIPNMGAISSVDLLKNDIGVAQAEDLVGILKGHPTLKSLCGNKGNETALDMSGKMNGAADAIMLVGEIIENRALLQLDISDHILSTENERAIVKLCDSKGIRLALEAAIPSVFGGGSDY
jgi:hypothetical protein